MLQIFLIAAAISIDSFSVGVAFGIRNIKVPLRSILILDFISVTLLSCGFFAGNILSRLFPPKTTELFGSIVIIIIGTWYLTQGFLNYKYPKEKIQHATAIATISIKSLGIAINILRDPSQIDLDVSGIIDTKEAILLGFALAVDSLAVGVALSISSIGMILLTLVLVATINLILLQLGTRLGKHYFASYLGEKTAFIPGIILISMGILRIF